MYSVRTPGMAAYTMFFAKQAGLLKAVKPPSSGLSPNISDRYRQSMDLHNGDGVSVNKMPRQPSGMNATPGLHLPPALVVNNLGGNPAADRIHPQNPTAAHVGGIPATQYDAWQYGNDQSPWPKMPGVLAQSRITPIIPPSPLLWGSAGSPYRDLARGAVPQLETQPQSLPGLPAAGAVPPSPAPY